MIYTPNDSVIKITVSNLSFHKSFFQHWKFDNGDNSINFTFMNHEHLPDNTSFTVNSSTEKIKIHYVQLDGDYFVAVGQLLDSVINEKISISYKNNDHPIFKQVVNLEFYGQYSLLYCPNPTILKPRGRIVENASLVIAGLYLITFLFSIFSCKKILGVELMYLIQLTFYSLMSKDISCDPFRGLEMLKYASGMTPLPFTFLTTTQTSLPANYSLLGI